MFNATMKFDLGEDVNALREAVHRWAQERVKPMAAEIDASNTFPHELWKEMGDLGLLGLTVPEEEGGSAFEPLRQSDQSQWNAGAEGQIPARTNVRRACRCFGDE